MIILENCQTYVFHYLKTYQTWTAAQIESEAYTTQKWEKIPVGL